MQWYFVAALLTVLTSSQATPPKSSAPLPSFFVDLITLHRARSVPERELITEFDWCAGFCFP